MTYYKARAVLQFDLATVPTENVEIIEATLSLYGTKYDMFANGTKDAKPVTRNWVDEATNWTMPWSSKGGSATNSNKGSCSNTAFSSWDDYDVTAAMYERHLKGEFYGFLLDIPGDNQAIQYHSSESSRRELRPKMTITYRILEQEAPVVNITTPNDGSEILPHSETTFEWIASDNSGITYQKLWFKAGSANPILLDSVDGTVRTLQWQTPCVGDGFQFIVEAFDEVGNRGVDSSDLFAVMPDTVSHKGSNALMVSADWYGATDNLGSHISYEKGDSVWCSMTLAKKSGSEYPWVNLSAELHDTQKLSGTAFIKIVYRANKPVKMNLQDPSLTKEGISHYSVLPRSTKKRVLYLHVDSCAFTQPDWLTNTSGIDLEKVQGLSFEPDIDPLFGGSVEMEIYDVVLYGYSGTIAALGGGTPATSMEMHMVDERVLLRTDVNGLHELKLFQLNGVELYSTTFSAQRGRKTVSIRGGLLGQKPFILQLCAGGRTFRKLIYLQ